MHHWYCFAFFFKSLLQEKVSLESSITDLQKEIQDLKQDNGLLMEKLQVSALIKYLSPLSILLHDDIFSQNNYLCIIWYVSFTKLDLLNI